jgi:hypothetical protein
VTLTWRMIGISRSWPTDHLLKTPTFCCSQPTKKMVRPDVRMLSWRPKAKISARASTSIPQPDGSPDSPFSNLSLQIPDIFSFCPPSTRGLINDCNGLTGQMLIILNAIRWLMAPTSKPPNDFRCPHGYGASSRVGSRVIVD